MKIAILSTPSAPLPPVGYAGIERVVYELQKGLTKKNHDVTVFATGDSIISSKLAYYYEKSLGPSVKLTYNSYFFLNHIYEFVKYIQGKSFDIIHLNDAGRYSLYFSQFIKQPFITTLHGSYFPVENDPYDIRKEKINQLHIFKNTPFISISNIQRIAIPDLNYIGTVYNSVDMQDYSFSDTGGDYICWLGRVTPAKGLDTAIEISESLSRQLHAFGFVDAGEQSYFETAIKPHMGNLFNFSGAAKEVSQKNDFYRGSKVFLFPIRWHEPFGIVMAEAMACGTPVVAYARGSVPEVVIDGVTGFIVHPDNENHDREYIIKKTGAEGLREAVERIYAMPESEYRAMRAACRKHIENSFTTEKMAEGYLEAYQKVLA